MHTPTPHEWQQVADIAERLANLLDGYPDDASDKLATAQALADDLNITLLQIHQEKAHDLASYKAAMAEVAAEKVADRQLEALQEMYELLGGVR